MMNELTKGENTSTSAKSGDVNALHRARNCDRFQTASEVSAYWNSNVRTVPLPHDAYGMRIDGETYPTFLDWLMAPAKEGK